LELNGTMTLRSVDYAGSFVYFDGTQTLSGLAKWFCGYRQLRL